MASNNMSVHRSSMFSDESMIIDSESIYVGDFPTLPKLQKLMKSDNTGFIVNWYELGLELLNQSTSVRTLKEIKANCQNVNECCLKMFEEWLSQMPTANWDQLITALSNIGMGTAAKHIKDSLKQGNLYSARLDYNVGDEKSDERQLHARIITKLKGKYVSVVRKIRLIIEERNYKIEQLILDLCATDDDKQTIFSTDEAFVKITNLTQLFLWIEKYCSMYDYELLLALVESTECNEAIKLLDDFSEELQSSILKDLDLLSQEGELRDMKSFMAGTCKLEIKYVGGKCTLTTKENVQRIIRECFHLKKGSIIFRGAQEGCVTLIYQISPTVKSYLLQYQISSEDAIKLTSIKIKCLIIDGTEFFISSQPKEVVSDLSSPQNTSDFEGMLSHQFNKVINVLRPEEIGSILLTLKDVFDSIMHHPDDSKYYLIKVTDKMYDLWRYPDFEQFMKLSGWVIEDGFMRLSDNLHVHTVSQLLDSIHGHKDDCTVQGFSIPTKCPVEVYQAVSLAVFSRNLSNIKKNLRSCDMNSAGWIYSEDGSSINILYTAILSQEIQIVKLLVRQYSVDPYFVDSDGDSIMSMIFAMAPESFIISLLNVCGAKMSYLDPNTGFTIFHNAVIACCFDVIKFLVEQCKADINIRSAALLTPLHVAYMAGHIHIAQYLEEHGAHVLATDEDGCITSDYINGVPKIVALSQGIQTERKIRKVPGSSEYNHFVKLREAGITVDEAIAQTLEIFPFIKESKSSESDTEIDSIHEKVM